MHKTTAPLPANVDPCDEPGHGHGGAAEAGRDAARGHAPDRPEERAHDGPGGGREEARQPRREQRRM